MKYENVVPAVFLSRPNRFIAVVSLDGEEKVVHVKNTGRCRELLIPGRQVWLSGSSDPRRRTAYDLIAVKKREDLLVNIDSQAPNRVVREWLDGGGFGLIRPEYSFGDSRIDFYMESGDRRFLLEVKGCTLEADGVGYFPDAPTVRGVRHLRELVRARRDGMEAAVAFVIQMEGVYKVRPNVATHPEFGAALEEAAGAGVRILYLPCRVAPDELEVTGASARDVFGL